MKILAQLRPPKKIKDIIYGTRKYEELTLEQNSKYLPKEAKELKEKTYNKLKDKE